MVEGHGVHRVAERHKEILLGRRFKAYSPNGRFKAGAKTINGKMLTRIEAIGKNLFYFFAHKHVLHIHFGMSGRFATFPPKDAPDVKPTTRLVLLDGSSIVAHLSAMTVELGSLEDYEKWASKLGPDPLRDDADFERLWSKCGKPNSRGGKAPIGSVLMDQSKVAGVGNIYRAEILFKAGVHPEQPSNTLGRERFELVWFHCCDLMRRGFHQGSILTVDSKHKKIDSKRRRYIYNQTKCLLCKSKIKSWDMKSRTCYACLKCQPLQPDTELANQRAKMFLAKSDVKVFRSLCAPEASDDKKTKKRKRRTARAAKVNTIPRKAKRKMRSAAAAALEKISAGEKRNVEHVALEDQASYAVISSRSRRKSRRLKQ